MGRCKEMIKTKIEWCDCTINPVVGCPRGCPYCYARRMNDRFGLVEDFSKPRFFPERLEALKSKKPQSIFMNSMSDFAFWTNKQVEFTRETIQKNPQHNYIFLTKGNEGLFYDPNCFNGLTVTRQPDLYYNNLYNNN